MSWTETTRAEHDRRRLRSASDAADEEWALIAPMMPPAARVGRPREADLRDVWNAIQHIAATGCRWLALPKDHPPYSTVQYWFYQFREEGLLELINDDLAMAARREAQPTAGLIDSQSVKSTESGGPSGYDAGKK